MDVKFPILIKKGKVFVWYSNHWININLMALANGGGLKGYYRFFKGFIECIFGKHRYTHVFRTSDWTSHIQCSYCQKEKDNEKDTVV